jgi:hypothetical protein
MTKLATALAPALALALSLAAADAALAAGARSAEAPRRPVRSAAVTRVSDVAQPAVGGYGPGQARVLLLAAMLESAGPRLGR